MKPKLIFKTYHPEHKAKYYGEQVFFTTLFKDIVEEVDSLEGLEGAIINIRGCDNIKYIENLNEDLMQLKWCIVLVTGNENSTDFYRNIKHPNCKIWLQTPKIGDSADYYMPFGWPTDVREFLPEVMPERKLNWSFAGQVTHERRKDSAEVMKGLNDGKLVETNSFNQGLSYPEYIKLLTETKVVPCPGGAATPDTFRVYEALECGAIPVLDQFSGRGNERGFWDLVLPGAPLWTVDSWKIDFPLILDEILKDYEKNQKVVAEWWQAEKQSIVDTLSKHITELL